MKRIIITFLLLFNTNAIFSQNVEELIQQLYSDVHWENIVAVDEIIYFNIEEAFYAIDELYDQKPPIVQSRFLEALQLFGDPLLYDRLIDYIDRADDFINEEFPLDPLTEKVNATYLLFTIEQYQTYNYIFEIIDRDGINDLSPTAFNSLDIILNNVPSAENQAKNILISIWENSTNNIYRSLSQFFLVKKYGAEMLDRVLTSFTEDEYLPIRISALEHLSSFNYSELNSLLKTRLIIDPSSMFRDDIADTLLEKFGEPSDLKAVLDYQPTEPDETTRSLMGTAIENFIPPKPGNLSLLAHIEKLISYTDELYEYQWILPDDIFSYYIDKLNELRAYIEEENYEIACTLITETLLPQIEQDMLDEVITIEGYKFLHYHSIYIKEKIEDLIGTCQ